MPDLTALAPDVKIILDHLEWKEAMLGGFSSIDKHRQLAFEERPFPTCAEALEAARRIEKAVARV